MFEFRNLSFSLFRVLAPGGAFQVLGGYGCPQRPHCLGEILLENVEEFSEQNLIVVDSLQ